VQVGTEAVINKTDEVILIKPVGMIMEINSHLAIKEK
jgi:hypothetical protein